MAEKQNKYVTNTVSLDRYNVNNIIDAETNNEKFQQKLQDKYKRNVYIQKYDDRGKSVQVGFLHSNGKLKSNIYYNKDGQPIREVYRSNYGIGDYTAISDFIYDSNGTLTKIKTKIDDGTEYERIYQ